MHVMEQFFCTLKMCHSDWFNKKLNGQERDRILRAEGMLGRRKQSCQPESKQDVKEGT